MAKFVNIGHLVINAERIEYAAVFRDHVCIYFAGAAEGREFAGPLAEMLAEWFERVADESGVESRFPDGDPEREESGS
jgi:hypothetical protein